MHFYHHLFQTGVLLGLVGHGTAKPFPQLHPRGLQGVMSLNQSDYHAMCESQEFDDADPQTRAAIWQDTGAGIWLDKWLIEHGEQDWLNALDEEISPDGLPTKHCDDIESSCPAPESCKDYFDKGKVQVYYIFTAVSVVHDLLKILHEELQSEAISEILDIPSIAQAFEVPLPKSDPTLVAQITAMMTIGSGIACLADPEAAAVIGPAMSILIGVTNLVGQPKPKQEQEPVDPAVTMDAQLKQIFEATERQIEAFPDNAFNGVDTYNLPNQTGNYTTPTAKFFADGKYLLKTPGHQFRPMIQQAFKPIRKTLVMSLLKASGYFVMVNTDVTKEDDCGSSDLGTYWQEEEEQCFNLFRFDDGDTDESHDAKDSITNIMKTKYDIHLQEFYENAWDCAVNFPAGNGQPDTNFIPGNNTLPTCFYNLPVIRGSYNREDGGKTEDADIDTT